MPKRSLNNSKAHRTYHQGSDDEKSVQELDPRKENSISEHSMPDYAREEETEPSVVELDDDEEIQGSMPSNEWDEEAMSSIPETDSQLNDDENSNSQGPLPDRSEEDPELLYFIKNGRFEDDLIVGKPLPQQLTDNFQQNEYTPNEINKLINNEVNKIILRTDEEKDNLKAAIKDVMLAKKPRKTAILEHEVDWCIFTSTISRLYNQLELSNFGMKYRTIPEFNLNLLEICLDKGEKGEGDGENPSTINGPLKKKYKSQMDTSAASSHATFNRRLGDCVPEHWRTNYSDLVRFCIRKSIDMTLSLKADRNDLEGTLNKCRAIEHVILENGNAKTAAINYGINYSTLHNYTHRAMVTIAKVLGDTEVPEKTVQLLKKKTPFEEICKAMNVTRAPTLARFVKGEQKEA